MVTRVGKFLGGLGADVTSVANVHATENRIAFGASKNPVANVDVVGNVAISTDIVIGNDLSMLSDGAILKMGTSGEIDITHVHNTGIKVTDSGGSPTIQLHDANEAISSDGSKLILTSNGVTFSLPTADGDGGQVIQTDGSGILSFTDVTTTKNPATALAINTDCGTLAGGAGADTKDAFGQAIDDAFVNLDCLLYAENALGTVDMGALS